MSPDLLRDLARRAGAEVAAGPLRGPATGALLAALPFLEHEESTDDAPDLPRGAVPYLPCAVDDILELVRSAPVGFADEVVDIGSGLGRVAILVHLLTGARTQGIEIQELLVRGARSRCEELALGGVGFVHANAADVALDGSIFFLYAPCNGAMLRSVLGRIEEVARRRRIVVGAVGLELREVPWLRPRPPTSVSLALYDSAAYGPSR